MFFSRPVCLGYYGKSREICVFWTDKLIRNLTVFNNIKIPLHYSVYMRTSGEKVRISDEAECVQSVSYSHIRSLSGLYAGVCLREGKRGTCLGPPFATVMCKVPCFQRPPTAVVMCNDLAFKGTQNNCNAWALLFQKVPLTSLICSASYFNLGDRSFLRGDKWCRDWILCPPPVGGYGERLIRLCLCSEKADRSTSCLQNCGI